MIFNEVVESLPPYPMEELAKIKKQLLDRNQEVFDFGTGDPRIPTWPKILHSIRESLPEVSQYPSIRGDAKLTNACWSYLKRRFDIDRSDDFMIIPSNGSKEAVFHMAACLVGRDKKFGIGYPNPGYPIYRSSTIFAKGNPYPISLDPISAPLLQPWYLQDKIQKDLAALWINYPHNPTGTIAGEDYFNELLAWSTKTNTPILSDECYTDIYDPVKPPPRAILQHKHPLTISFFSLSKRSGLTGYRTGFIFGHKNLLNPLVRARANFGLGTPTPIQLGAVTAWLDDAHVEKRREIFFQRMETALPTLKKLGMLDKLPYAGFYLWCNIPKSWKTGDISFSLALADKGVITSPSSWLGEGIVDKVRFAMVPEKNDIQKAMKILEAFVLKR